MAEAEPLITFTEGGLEGFSYTLSPAGCLEMGFPSLGASVCAVRDRQGQTEREREKINGLAHHGKLVNIL